MKTKRVIVIFGALLLAGSLLNTAYAANRIPGATAQPQKYFYTGKPYDKDLGAYVFASRNYNPAVCRWISSDPSGFPDGANNQSYAPVPTYDFDYQGLLKWSTLKDTGNVQTYTVPGTSNVVSWEIWTVQTNDGSATINLWKYIGGEPAGSDYSYNCMGYVFGNSQYWINGQTDAMLKGDGYHVITGSNYTGAKIAYWATDVHVADVVTVDSNGNVTVVTGKLGAGSLTTSAPADQGYGTGVTYYE